MANDHKSVYSALIANVFIASTKFVAGIITRSSSMISEGVHTMVDICNDLLLLYGIKKSRRPPDDAHPWGYGKELYFWSVVVSILIFGFGGGVTIYQGVHRILHPEDMKSPLWNYLVLGISAFFESISLFISGREFNKTRDGLSWWAALVKSKDPSNFIVLVEDVADVLGLLIVFISLIITQLFHTPYADGIGSVVVGLLLVVVSTIVARESRSLLMGEGITAETRRRIIEETEKQEEVTKVVELFSNYQSPEEIVLIMTICFQPLLKIEDLNNVIPRIKQNISNEFGLIKFIVIQSQPMKV